MGQFTFNPPMFSDHSPVPRLGGTEYQPKPKSGQNVAISQDQKIFHRIKNHTLRQCVNGSIELSLYPAAILDSRCGSQLGVPLIVSRAGVGLAGMLLKADSAAAHARWHGGDRSAQA